MTQEDTEAIICQRIRGLRLARGWTLDALAARCNMSASTLSRIETGNRRVAVEQLIEISRALGTSLDHLVQPTDGEDVVIRPVPEAMEGVTAWMLSRDQARPGTTIAKLRYSPEHKPSALRVHPGYEWFTVLSGTIRLQLGERILLITEGQAAEFSTMTPHSIQPHQGTAEILTIFDYEGERAHLPGRQRPGSGSGDSA